jgi:hypothetical protein
MNDLTLTESTLLLLLSHALFETPVDISDDGIDWKEVEREAKAQAVFPLAFHKLNTLPSEIQSEIQMQIMKMVANNMKVEWNHLYTNDRMNEGHIPYVILKGCASAYYYPEPIYRSMGDVDILVSHENLASADKILRRDGLVPWEQNHICHIVYKKPGMHLELHFEPAGVPEGKAGELVRSYLEDIFDTSVVVKAGDGTLRVPDDFHHGLVLLLHTCHHLTGEGIGLRHLCDWAVFVNRLSNDTFKALFEEKLKAIGLWRFAQLLCQLSSCYLGLPEQEWAMQDVDEELLYAMIQDIFEGGNFGCKDSQRVHETMIISNRGKNGVGHSSMLRQFFSSMNHIVYLNWPISVKAKVLLPLGWFFYGGRYMIRVLIGKRKGINITKMVSSAMERREIYKDLHLYE